MPENPLVRRFLERRDVLLGFLYARTRDLDAAEEILQEVAVEVVQEDGKGTQVADFPAWIREVARRRAAAHFRSKSRRKAVAALPEDLLDRTFEENDLAPEEALVRQRHLQDCLERLPDRPREALRRRYRDWMSPAQIAAALSWKAAAVRVLLSRARKTLLDCVQSKLRAGEAS